MPAALGAGCPVGCRRRTWKATGRAALPSCCTLRGCGAAYKTTGMQGDRAATRQAGRVAGWALGVAEEEWTDAGGGTQRQRSNMWPREHMETVTHWFL